jgi:hypothetical protein
MSRFQTRSVPLAWVVVVTDTESPDRACNSGIVRAIGDNRFTFDHDPKSKTYGSLMAARAACTRHLCHQHLGH